MRIRGSNPSMEIMIINLPLKIIIKEIYSKRKILKIY